MGLFGRSRALLDAAQELEPAPKFTVGIGDVDPSLFGLPSYNDPLGPAPRVARHLAIQSGPVKRARDLICGTLGSLPLSLVDAGNNPAPNQWTPLFDQPERHRPKSVTLTQLADDLFFHGVAWWLITETSWTTYPSKVVRLDPQSVSVIRGGINYRTGSGNSGLEWQYAEDSQLIRFDSPNDPFLVAAARAIRSSLKLDAAADRFADGVPPLDYFSPAEGADPAEDEDVQDLLDAWKAARQTRSTAYVPASLAYHTTQQTASDIGLSDARQHVALELARHAGIDPSYLGIAVNSETYQSVQQRSQGLVNETLGAFAKAICDRLSMGDVSPRGYTAQIDFNDLTKADFLSRMQGYVQAKSVGAMTVQEIRAAEGRPDLPPDQIPQPPAPSVPPALPPAPDGGDPQ